MTAIRCSIVLSLWLATSAASVACETSAPARDGPAFPLSAHGGKRYLEDATGRPFLLNGDTAWSLIAQLTREEAELYLTDRKARGFNTILVNLLEHRFSTKAPANIYGDRPFLVDGDYSTPNEAYFRHADWVLRRACQLGLTVLLAPSYVGNGGGPEGWYKEMVRSGVAKLREYGRFLGRRYAALDNIIWVHGGDYNPPDKDLVRAIADGIRETDPNALHTAHAGPGTAALEYWRGEPWLSLNNVYTYEPVYRAALKQFSDPSGMPFFLMESAYENEHGATDQRIRVQAYQALLSGAAGQVFGNNPIWHFAGPGLYPVEASWQEALDSPGARSMTLLHGLFSSVQWWLLEPDLGRLFLVGGVGRNLTRTVAAVARDGSFALVYTPEGHGFELDLARLSGPRIAARWFDPSDGRFSTVEGSPFPGARRAFMPPPRNGAGSNDWILVLTTEAAQSQ